MNVTLGDVEHFSPHPKNFVTFLQQQHLLQPPNYFHFPCNTEPRLNFAPNRDGVIYRCSCQRGHKRRVTADSFFDDYDTRMSVILKIIIHFNLGTHIYHCAHLLNIKAKLVSRVYRRLHELITENLAFDPITFPDVGIFEADETFYEHVAINTADHIHFIHEYWIGGVLERSTGKCLIYSIADRSHNSVCPPIFNNVPHHSLVCTDEWGGYNEIVHHNYIRRYVTHSHKEYLREDTVEGFEEVEAREEGKVRIMKNTLS